MRIKTYKARDLAIMPKDELWALPEGPIRVEFDDGVLETKRRATIFSAYMWGLYALYPKTPALKKHHLKGTDPTAQVTSDTHLKLLGHTFWACYDAYDRTVPIERLCLLTYQAVNRIYNDFTYRLEAHVRTLSILDFMDVIFHPDILKANQQVQPTQTSIDGVYRVIEKVLRDPAQLPNNPIANAAKSGLVRMGQINHCVGPRGYLTDKDSNVFPNPILVGYAHGIRTAHDLAIESRSATKSLSFTEKPLQETEYFNRRLQLLANVVTTLFPGDCGSTYTVPWRLRPGDMRFFLGKYYVKDDGSLDYIREEDRKKLVGEMLQLRSPTFCNHGPMGVCETCFGDLSLSIPPNTNVGHVSATALCEQMSQRVLSVKHEDGVADVATIELSDYDKYYLKMGSDPNTLKLADRLSRKKVIMVISAAQAEYIKDTAFVDDVRQLQIGFVSSLTEIEFKIETQGGGEERGVVPVALGTRYSSMSHELLAYVKEHGWASTAGGTQYEIDLSMWDVDEPLLLVPFKHMNMLDYMNSIDSFLKGSKVTQGTGRTLLDFDTVHGALQEFYGLVSTQLFVNVAHLEVILKAMMIRSSVARDYRMPWPGNVVEFGQFNDIIEMRSLGTTMAYEGHKRVINDPANYLPLPRPDSILDPLLLGPKV